MLFNITQKRCCTCKNIKSVSEFGKDKGRPDGLDRRCRSCERARDKKRYAKNPERKIKQVRNWTLANLDKVRKMVLEWNKNNSDKVRAHRRKTYANNPSKILEQNKMWFIRHPESRKMAAENRRARLMGNGGKITAKEWRALCDKYGNKCLCCGRNDVKLTLDHVVPLSKGGANTIDNAQPLCGTCNNKKFIKNIDYRV